MSAKSIILSLQSKDLSKTESFYKNALGLTEVSNEGLVVSVDLNGSSTLLFIVKDRFEKYTKRANLMPQNPSMYANSIISIQLESAEDMDSILEKVEEYDGIITVKPVEDPYGQSAFIQDPDGHLIELVVIEKK